MGYYTGDPGFFSLVRSIGSGLASFIPGAGPIASKVISKIPVPVRGAAMKAGAAIVKHPVISAAGGAAVLAAGGVEAGRLTMGGARGRHKPSARHLRALAMGLKRARPRMNVTNAHALRRALRRTYGFARLAMKTIHLVHPKKKARFGGFKRRRKR